MSRLYDAILGFFITPGDLIADRLGVTKDENRDLVRMLNPFLDCGGSSD